MQRGATVVGPPPFGSINHTVASRCRMKLLLLSLLATALHQVPAMPTSVTNLRGSYLLPPHDESESILHETTTYATPCLDPATVFHTSLVTSHVYQTDYKTDTITATNVVYHSRTRTMTVVDDVIVERSVITGVTETLDGTVTKTKYITVQTVNEPEIQTLTETSTFVLPSTHVVYETTTETTENTVTQTHYESGTIYSTDPFLSTSFVTETITPVPHLETAVIQSTYTIDVFQPPSTIISTKTTTSVSTVQTIVLRTPTVRYTTLTDVFSTIQYETKTAIATTTSTEYKVSDVTQVHQELKTLYRTLSLPVIKTVTQILYHTLDNVAETTTIKPTILNRHSVITEISTSSSLVHVTNTHEATVTERAFLPRLVSTAVSSLVTLIGTSTVRVSDVYTTQTIVVDCTQPIGKSYSYPAPSESFNYN